MRKLLSTAVLCLVFAVALVPCVSYGKGHGGGGGHRGGGGHGGHYSGGHSFGGHSRYYYRGYAPRGAVFGAFLAGSIIGGVYNPYWWPYYAVSVPPAYYDPYYQYPYPAPPYVIEVPPTEATTASLHGPPPAATPPNQCYAPKTDTNGNIVKDDNGNMTPDFTKPVPCPPQQ
jgi:hypothetical protein